MRPVTDERAGPPPREAGPLPFASRWGCHLGLLFVFVVLLFFLPLVSHDCGHKTEEQRCTERLELIGEKLLARRDRGELEMLSGRDFLLQIVPDLDDDELGCFVCAGDMTAYLESPEPNTPEFVALYREGGRAPCSWAGPDWERCPPGDGSTPRIWACDRCFHDVPAHNGVHVLWSTGEVEFLRIDDIAGADLWSGLITTGEGSKDPRLATMRAEPPDGD